MFLLKKWSVAIQLLAKALRTLGSTISSQYKVLSTISGKIPDKAPMADTDMSRKAVFILSVGRLTKAGNESGSKYTPPALFDFPIIFETLNPSVKRANLYPTYPTQFLKAPLRIDDDADDAKLDPIGIFYFSTVVSSDMIISTK